jgi:hypothetical protein
MEMAVRIRLTSANGSAGTGPLWPEGSSASHRWGPDWGSHCLRQ